MNVAVRPRGPLETLDRVIELVRSRPLAELARALAPGALIAWLLLALYYLERVEGVRSLRPLFALALVAAFGARSVVLGRWARACAERELRESGVELEPERGSTEVLRASLWVGFELWFWLWPVVLVLRTDPWLLPILLLAWCVRAALAPSWLVVVHTHPAPSGFGAMRAAVLHCEGQRGQAVLCELCLLLGAIGLAFNLGAVLALVISLGQTALGLDLSLVRAFISPQNHFALLCLGAVALVVMEPLRAGLAARLFVDAELLRGGAAVRMLVTRALTPRTRGSALQLGIALLWLSPIMQSQAQEPAAPSPEAQQSAPDEEAAEAEQPEAEAIACEDLCVAAQSEDDALRGKVAQILRAPEFAEFPDEGWKLDSLGQNAFQKWITNLLRRWLKLEDPEDTPKPEAWSLGALPGSSFFLVLAVLLLMLALARLAFGFPRSSSASDDAAEKRAQVDPFELSTDEHLKAALELFAKSPREAMRSVYLGALVGLARRNLLQLNLESTNGQYVRQLAGHDERAPFKELTRTFDAVFYGHHPLDARSFEHCHALAQRLAGRSAPSGAQAENGERS